MWETIKNDPILKTFTIIILGVLGFGFAFNIMFGQNTRNGMEGGDMGGGGYSLENTLSYILLIAFKLFLIAVVIVLLVTLVKLALKYLIKGENWTMEKLNQNAILKILVIGVLAIISIGLIWVVLGGLLHTGSTMNGNNMNTMMNGNYSYNMMGTGTSFGLGSILTFLVKSLLFVSVAGVIIGLGMYLFRNFPKATNTTQVTATMACQNCGTELKQEWKCCPECGQEKAAVQKQEPVEDQAVVVE